MGAHTCNPSTPEIKDMLPVQDQAKIHSKTLSQKQPEQPKEH